MAFITCLTAWGFVNSFGVFQTYYADTMSESQSTISWIGSIQVWVIFAVGMFSGRALDAGLFFPTFLLGSALQILGVFTTSVCRNFWQLLLAQGFCTGLGCGMIFCPVMGIVTTYFERNRALAVAIVSTGNSIGGILYPVLVKSLLPKIGFAWTIRILGFVNLACLVAAAMFLSPRLPPREGDAFIEWRIFLNIPYTCMVISMALVFGGVFFTLYFVRILLILRVTH
jgi:MFS family permease